MKNGWNILGYVDGIFLSMGHIKYFIPIKRKYHNEKRVPRIAETYREVKKGWKKHKKNVQNIYL